MMKLVDLRHFVSFSDILKSNLVHSILDMLCQIGQITTET